MLYIKEALNEKDADASIQQLTAMCKEHPLSLTLAISYIQQSTWVDCATYLHMLEDRGVSSDGDGPYPAAKAAFDITMNALDIRRKFFNDRICSAVRQILIISVICENVDLDFIFLSVNFPVFPDPLGEICADKEMRKRLVEKLKMFGVFEIREGVLHSNTHLNTLSTCHFMASDKNGICSFILDRMEKRILEIRENRYTENADALIALAKPYISEAFTYMVRYGNMQYDKLTHRYPNVYQIAQLHPVE